MKHLLSISSSHHGKIRGLFLVAVALFHSLGFTAKAQSYEFEVSGNYFFDSYTDTQDPITVSGFAYTPYLYLAYGGFSINVSSSGGDITKVEFETMDGTMAANVNTGSFDPATITWTGSATDITFTAAKNDQFISKITVYVGADDTPKEIVFEDGKPYNGKSTVRYDKITYTRNFSDTKWKELYVPFSINYEEWSDKFEIARIYNFIDYDDNNDGVFDRTYLVVQKKVEGSTEPNVPYVIRAKQAGDQSIVMSDRKMMRAEQNSYSCRSVDYIYTFSGTYSEVTNMYAKGYYAMADGSLKKAKDATVKLAPQRWYMEMTARDNNYNTRPLSFSILVNDEDDVEGIIANEVEYKNDNAAFDLQGRKTKGGIRGIQIINGKKIIR